MPGEVKRQLEFSNLTKALSVTKTYPDPFVEAANTFLNQLAITAFNKLIKDIGNTDKNITGNFFGGI